MNTENKEIIDVKKERRFLKSLYFVMFLAFGSISPFSIIFLKHIFTNPDGSIAVGLIGIIIASTPIIGFFANITIGVLSDKFGMSRKLITILAFIGAFTAVIVGFSGTQAIMELPLEQKFILLFAVILAYNFVVSSLEPLVNSETLQHLNKHSDRKKFGTIRIWGTFGWAISALAMGIILAVSGKFWQEGMGENYRLIYYGGAAAMLTLGILGIKARSPSIKKPKISYSHILKDTRFLRFLVFAFFGGIIMTSTDIYLPYFIDDVSQNSAIPLPLIIGFVYCFWVTFEIPVLANADKLLKKFGSKKLFLAGMFCIMLKLLFFSQLQTGTSLYWVFLILATLTHGLAFSFHFIALMDYLDRYAHKDMKTSYIAAMTIVRGTFAGVAGGAIGAVVIANFGSTMLMQGGAAAMVFLAVFFLLFVKNPREG